mgnify:CR=1 FL=1
MCHHQTDFFFGNCRAVDDAVDIAAAQDQDPVTQFHKNIQILADIDDGDTLSCAPDAEVYDGMTIQAATVARHRQTYTTTIDYGTVYCYDSAIPQGLEETVTPGVSGEMLCMSAAWYGFGRFFIEGLRTDSLATSGGLRTSQIVAVVTVVASVIFIVYNYIVEKRCYYESRKNW